MASWLLRLLGGFDLWAAERRVELPLPAQRLLAYLALQARPVRRSAVATVLWPDAAAPRAAASLRSTLWRCGPPQARPVHADRGHVWLSHEVVTDVRRVEREAGEGLDPALLKPLLPDWHDDWVVGERERLRLLFVTRLERLSTLHLEQGRPTLAVEAAAGAIALEPFRETAHRRLIDALVASGNGAQALHHYEQFRADLDAALQVAPSRALMHRVADICAVRRR